MYQHHYYHEKNLAYTGTTYARKLFANISKINIDWGKEGIENNYDINFGFRNNYKKSK